jgi:myo-inositol-1(or 4)-monophosphatase
MKPWDVAAGTLLVREAGGVVLDFKGDDKVEHSDTIVAAPYKLMTQMQQLINKHWQPKNGAKGASK